jgi:hypothetical protein
MIFMFLVGIILVFILFFYSIIKVQNITEEIQEKDLDKNKLDID